MVQPSQPTRITLVLINSRFEQAQIDSFNQHLQVSLAQTPNLQLANLIVRAGNLALSQSQLKLADCADLVFFTTANLVIGPSHLASLDNWAHTATNQSLWTLPFNNMEPPLGCINTNCFCLTKQGLSTYCPQPTLAFDYSSLMTMTARLRPQPRVTWSPPSRPLSQLKLTVPIYMINLARRQDKLIESLYRLNLNKLSLVRAIDGAQLDLACLPPYDLRGESLDQLRGAIGCSQSHSLLWLQLAQSDPVHQMGCIIMEDDVFIDDRFQSVWPKLVQALPEDCDLCYLGCNQPALLATSELIRRVNPETQAQFGTYSYYVTPRGIHNLVQLYQNQAIKTPKLDWWLREQTSLNQYYCQQVLIGSALDYKTDVQRGDTHP